MRQNCDVRLAKRRLGLSEATRYQIADQVVEYLLKDDRWPELKQAANCARYRSSKIFSISVTSVTGISPPTSYVFPQQTHRKQWRARCRCFIWPLIVSPRRLLGNARRQLLSASSTRPECLTLDGTPPSGSGTESCAAIRGSGFNLSVASLRYLRSHRWDAP